MTVTYQLLLSVPEYLRRQWSEATVRESHLVSETPESLESNVAAAVIAFAGDRAVGFAALLHARTDDHQPVIHDGRAVMELGGAYTQVAWRGHGIWAELVRLRLAYAKEQDWCVVCISGNHIVQSRLRDFGGRPMIGRDTAQLRRHLCLGCEVAAACEFCPMSPGTAWIMDT